MYNTGFKIAFISSLNTSNKDIQPISISFKESFFSYINNIEIAIISIDFYQIACYLKEAQVFALSIKDLIYNRIKAKVETNLKSVIPKEYQDFRDLFSKKNFNTLPTY